MISGVGGQEAEGLATEGLHGAEVTLVEGEEVAGAVTVRDYDVGGVDEQLLRFLGTFLSDPTEVP